MPALGFSLRHREVRRHFIRADVRAFPASVRVLASSLSSRGPLACVLNFLRLIVPSVKGR